MKVAGRFKNVPQQSTILRSNQEAVEKLSQAILEQQREDAVSTVMAMPEAKALEQDFVDEYLAPEETSLADVGDLFDIGKPLELPANAVFATEADVHPAVTMALKEGSLFQALRRLFDVVKPTIAKKWRVSLQRI